MKLHTTIDGVTYDITNFVKTHPGGADMLMLGHDIDSSIMFHSYHRRLDLAEASLKKLPVIKGKSVASEIETPFWKELKKNVNQYFIDTKQSSKGNNFMFFKSFLLLFVTFSVYYISCMKGFWYLSPLLGICMAINGLAIQHDANHGSLSNSGIVNTIMGAVDDFVVGGSSLMWRHQHNVSHHVHPNDVEKDTDTYSNFPILKTNPKLPARFYLKFQHLYAPILYCFLGLAYYFGDFVTFFSGSYDKVKLHPKRFVDYFVFFGGKLFYAILFFYIPIQYYGVWGALFKFILPFQFVGSNFLASLFIVSHNTDDCEYNFKGDWAEQQIRTAANWSTHSTAWWLAAGGLNFQIEHHLFPGICHVHYPAISKIVQSTCKKYNVPYHSHPTYYEIYAAHLRGLYNLGNMK